MRLRKKGRKNRAPSVKPMTIAGLAVMLLAVHSASGDDAPSTEGLKARAEAGDGHRQDRSRRERARETIPNTTPAK